MKKLSYFILSVLMISLVSCSSDDNGDSGQDGSILGLWNSSEFILEGTFQEDGITVSFEGTADEMPGNKITFREDNTFIANSAPFMMEVHFVVMGIPYTETMEMSSLMTDEGTWRKEGNKLFISEAGVEEEQEFTIEILTNSTLKMFADQESIKDFYDDFPENAVFEVTTVHTR